MLTCPCFAQQKAETSDQSIYAGYLPGYRRAVGLGLSPYSPRTPTLPGGLTVPFGAPEPPNLWNFNFGGYMSAALRLSSGERELPTTDQFRSTLVAPPRTPDFYGAFQGTNAPPGSWVELRFDYGNDVVKTQVKLSTWKPTRGTNFRETGSQMFVNEAFLTYTVPALGDFSLTATAGVYRNTYGGLGQYGVGQYNAAIIGVPYGIGETLTAKYAVSSDFSLVLEHGLMGGFGKTPEGAAPSVADAAPSASRPSTLTHHAHVGFALQGEQPLIGGLHYLSNFSKDERDQVDDPKTALLDESNRPDAHLTVIGADFRMIDNYLGNAAIAVSYADISYAQLLTGMTYFGADNGEQLTKRYLGQVGGGTGTMLVAGFEYMLSLSRLLYYPQPFGGEGADIIGSVFANVASVTSKDPAFDGRTMYKFGGELTYRPLSWIALSGRYDHVAPNSKDSEQGFDVISPKLIFKSNWNSHETVTLSYTRWFYGDRVQGEFPNDYTREELDNQMFALNFGMWW
jgi:hypothetical protein